MAAEEPDLGAWQGDEARLAQARVSGRGSDSDLPDETRFGRAVTQLVLRRERLPEAEFDRPAAFVLTPPAWREGHAEVSKRNPMLHTGNKRLTGQIHLVSALMTGSSREFAGDDAALFDDLESIEVGSLPTLVYMPSKGYSKLTYYPSGTINEEDHELWEMAQEAPTTDSITAVIDRVHSQELVTPDQSTAFPLWEDAPKGWAHKEAEARVQHAVKCGLAGAFRTCSIRAEQAAKVGRTDLEIVEDEDRPFDQIIHHAVLELKVLREKGSGGSSYSPKTIAEHIQDGLEQAHAYGVKKSMREKLLCCFDMRSSDAGGVAVFAPLKAKAEQLEVHLRLWFLERASKNMRSAMSNAAIKPV